MENFDLESLKKFFPLTDKAVDGNGLLTCVICYIIVAAIGGILIAFVPIIGGILGAIIELWFVIGICLAVLTFLKAQGGGSNNNGGQQQ